MTTDTLQYEVTRSNRKTGDIIVERNGSVIVRVPHHIDDAQVSELIESKRLWIYKALAEWQELQQMEGAPHAIEAMQERYSWADAISETLRQVEQAALLAEQNP